MEWRALVMKSTPWPIQSGEWVATVRLEGGKAAITQIGWVPEGHHPAEPDRPVLIVHWYHWSAAPDSSEAWVHPDPPPKRERVPVEDLIRVAV